MPRTTTLECSGCPPLRALTFDGLGLIQVIESRGKQGGFPKVVERQGEHESSKCVLAASIDDCKSHPLLAVARKNGKVDVLNPLNGDLHVTISSVSYVGERPEDDPVVGLHLFSRKILELEWETLGCFMGKCSGSIRSIARHPEHPVILSCDSATALNGFLETASLLMKVTDEEVAHSAADASFVKAQNSNEIEDINEETEPMERKKTSKDKKAKKKRDEKKHPYIMEASNLSPRKITKD